MELTPSEKFNAMNGKHTNLKDCEGQEIQPVAVLTYAYTGADGNEHHVLVIKDGVTGEFYKTEVKAFQEKFAAYMDAFGALPDDERPRIRIIIKMSKKNNKYVNFELV